LEAARFVFPRQLLYGRLKDIQLLELPTPINLVTSPELGEQLPSGIDEPFVDNAFAEHYFYGVHVDAVYRRIGLLVGAWNVLSTPEANVALILLQGFEDFHWIQAKPWTHGSLQWWTIIASSFQTSPPAVESESKYGVRLIAEPSARIESIFDGCQVYLGQQRGASVEEQIVSFELPTEWLAAYALP
jgi:hypothetical protein